MGKFTLFLHDNFVPHIPKDPSNGDGVVTTTDEYISSPIKSEGKKEDDLDSIRSTETSSTAALATGLHRQLRGRHVQLLGIGATIGLALFVAIGKALAKGGPLNLLLAFIVWSLPILCITVSTAEFVSYLPIPSPFVRMAGRCCDEALEVAAAWNFWFLCCAQIPFEVVTVNLIIHYWRDDYSPAITLAVQVFLYFVINVFGVSIYGEVEFWLSLGKVILAVGLLFFTFITMVGGNPKHEAFGFRYWKNPGPMAEYINTGSLGRFQGFIACLTQACFTFAGPEYVSLVASETINPRKTLPSAFKQVFVRLTVFFIGGALSVGILVAYNDGYLTETMGASKPGAGGSPYVIAMQRLGIDGLPHVVNVLLVTSAFSAGNSYTFCSSRTLYGFALDGYAPKFLTATTKTGIPLYCMLISLAWAFLLFLQVDNLASKVLDWIINIITSCQLINFCVLCVVYLYFRKAYIAQGLPRENLPFKSWYQPYTALCGLAFAFVMLFVATYTVFLPGNWDVKSFLYSYLFIFIDVFLFCGYKLVRRTKWRDPMEVDLVTGLREVEMHEAQLYEEYAREGKTVVDGQVKQGFFGRLSTFVFGSEM